MSQTATQERRSALDEFAAGVAQSAGQLVPAPSYSLPADVPHGAMELRVRRDHAKVLGQLKVMAAEAAEDWYYRWPVQNRKKGTTDWVEGPSVKLTNALMMVYGNCRAYVPRIVDLGTHWEFKAVFVDFETGAELGRDFRQRKTGGKMGDDMDRREDIAFQIGESKALRNVVANALQYYSDFALREAMNSLVDKIGKNVERYRKQIAERARERNVELARIEAVVGRKVDGWLAADMARVIAMMTAVHDGMATLDETFPPLQREEQADQQLDQFAQSASGSAASSAPGSAEAGADGGSPQPPKPTAAAPAPSSEQTLEQDFQLSVLIEDTVDTVLRIASKFSASPQERRDNLALYLVPEPLMFYPDFVKALMQTAAKVADEELSVEAARKYVGSLPLKRRS